MSDDKKKREEAVGEDALDVLLARWAEAEIEPPAGFHEQTRGRLREIQQQKKETVLTRLVRKKRWMSAAAAAVLVLCCIPVVQGQFGHDITENKMDMRQEEVKQEEQAFVTQDKNGESQEAIGDAAQKSDTQRTQKDEQPKVSGEEKTFQDAVKQEVTAPVSAQTKDSAVDAAASEASFIGDENDNQGIAAYSLDVPEGESELDTLLKKGRSVSEKLDEALVNAQSYQDALEDLTSQLEDAQQKLQECDEKLQHEPENSQLQEQIDDLKANIETLKKEIEQMKELLAEAKATAEE